MAAIGIGMNESGEKIRQIERLSLIRGVYRSLIGKGRSYAAFEPDRIVPLITTLASRKLIFDPMAGYGGLLTLCAKFEIPVSSFGIEYNPPSYLWQMLIHPNNSESLIRIAERTLVGIKKYDTRYKRAEISDEWFSESAQEILENLYNLIFGYSKEISSPSDPRILTLSLMTPFVGRLASCVQGNIVTHVKKGGVVIMQDWLYDFQTYLYVIIERLKNICLESFNKDHIVKLGDCKTVDLENYSFPAMITSPPYPNSRDYASMFGPENEFLRFLEAKEYFSGISLRSRLIGSPCISTENGSKKATLSDVNSAKAKKFLNSILEYKGSLQAKYDNEVYYFPFFAKYFSDLEAAYGHISKSLATSFQGYIIVVNNTHRKMIVPVCEVVMEVWNNLGFRTGVVEKYTRELPHVGGLNPNVKGLIARHTEYTIRICR